MTSLARALVLVSLGGAAAAAQNPPARPEPLDGPARIFKDELLDHLQGRWRLGGVVMGKPREMDLSAQWVLNHQFLEIYERDASAAEGKPPYEALVHVGYDNASERYVVHWLDVFGGRWSETLGYGTRAGDSIRFVFEYPDGPFRNTFTWNPKAGTWRFLLEQKDAAGKWTTFADQTATAVK